jgi:hypothetical protein
MSYLPMLALNWDFPDSASQVASITSMSHQYPAGFLFLSNFFFFQFWDNLF